MRTLPKLPARIPHKQSQVLRFLGINRSDDYPMGSLKECKNITSRRYPYFSTRNERSKLDDCGSDNFAMAHFNKIITLSTGSNNIVQLTYGDVKRYIGRFIDKPVSFTMINNKVMIVPYNYTLDTSNTAVKPTSATVVIYSGDFTATENSITIVSTTHGTTYPDFINFSVGDTVTFDVQGHKNTIAEISDDLKTVTFRNPIPVTASDNFVIRKKTPTLDFITESDNRVWGCNTEENTIYASSLGNPGDWDSFEGLSTDSYSVGVGSEGEFTGCTKYGSAILFFKEECVHKILGSYPAEYALYTSQLDGVKKGCHKSLVEVNGVLYYLGAHGFNVYSGGQSYSINAPFGDQKFTDAVGGTDGVNYFVSCKSGEVWHLFEYDTKRGFWMEHDHTHVLDFARDGNTLYMLDADDGSVYIVDSGKQSKAIEWMMHFNPFVETVSGSYNSTSSLFNKKRYSKVIMRVEAEELSMAEVYVRFDGGDWQKKGVIYGKEYNFKPFVIGINRCDSFEIKIEGHGEFTLRNMNRTYVVGSDRS